MAKENKKAAQAAQAAPAATVNTVNEENIVDQIRNKNLQSSETVQAAMEELKKEKDAQKKREAMHAIKKHEYKNLRALLELRKRRAEDKATKEYLSATKETLDKFLAGELTPTEADEKDKKDTESKQKAFGEIDKDFSKQIKELQDCYPGYWSYTWDRMW